MVIYQIKHLIEHWFFWLFIQLDFIFLISPPLKSTILFLKLYCYITIVNNTMTYLRWIKVFLSFFLYFLFLIYNYRLNLSPFHYNYNLIRNNGWPRLYNIEANKNFTLFKYLTIPLHFYFQQLKTIWNKAF